MEYWSLESFGARRLYWHNDLDTLLENPIDYNLHTELYDSMILGTREYSTNIEILNCYLAKSKPTYLAVYPLIYRYGVDENLKEVLDNYILMNNKLIKTQYVYRNRKYSDLNLIYWKESIYDYINFNLCEIYFRPRSGQEDQSSKIIKVSDFSQFLEAKVTGILTFKKVVFNGNAPIFDWFYIDGILESNIVSSRLKEKIEKQGFSGIHFAPSKIQWDREKI